MQDAQIHTVFFEPLVIQFSVSFHEADIETCVFVRIGACDDTFVNDIIWRSEDHHQIFEAAGSNVSLMHYVAPGRAENDVNVRKLDKDFAQILHTNRDEAAVTVREWLMVVQHAIDVEIKKGHQWIIRFWGMGLQGVAAKLAPWISRGVRSPYSPPKRVAVWRNGKALARLASIDKVRFLVRLPTTYKQAYE